MKRSDVARACAVVFMLGLARGAAAQSTLVGQMTDFFSQSIVLARTPSGGGIAGHTAVFAESDHVEETEQLITQVSQQIGAQISNFPLGSTGGGFTFAYDPSTGTFSRTSETFGPSFAERANTLGRRRVSFGMTYLHTGYTSLDGHNLSNGSIVFNLLHQDLDPPSYVEGDVVQAKLGLDLTSNTTAFQFGIGATDKLDVGVAVPIVHVDSKLTYHATILDFATHTVSPLTHIFANGTKTADFSTSGEATGLGDVVVRGKYRLRDIGRTNLALGLDLRLPTGDESNMLGTGYAQTKAYAILSGRSGERLAPHANIGYTFGRSGNAALIPSDQFDFNGGIEVLVTPRVTFVADLLGRRLSHANRVEDTLTPHTFQQGQTAPIETTQLKTITLSDQSLWSTLGTAGVKVNVWRNWLLSAHLLAPVNGAGLRIKPTPVIGFDYAF